jgi:prophage maintenance system killer protein
MHYLSVHDLVWINNTITGKTLAFDYEALEACMAAQYSYGDSTNVTAQAADFLEAFLFKRPFEYANVRTAYVALTTFLNANGFAQKVDGAEAIGIIQDVAARRFGGARAIERLVEKAEITLRPGVALRALVTYVLNEHAETVQRLAAGDDRR